ncbi:MAG TPA: serine/threonine-protein kinase [Kofleriaceae bacterium]|nr:serine/threonine-protein kinase [Kofleriaceae bacterium]
MPNPQSGTILGAYRVEGTIGSGSMGEVFRGIDTGLNRRVAIKLLSEKHRDSPELRQRFVREGRAVAAISHPNVVQVFATGSYDDRPYIAMELLEGADLGSIVERSGRLDSLSAAHAVLDAAQGLAAAARAGLIHRDVKPSNLVRLADGKVKVTDFGLAKPVDPGSEPALTAMGVVVGTPDYIAPEQARGEAINERVDIYALGGTLYFLLTGVPPFRTGKPAEDKYLKVVARHLRNPPPDALAANPGCDRELAELTRAMMAKKPAERPGYDELIAQLSRIVSRLDPAAVPLLIASRDRSRPIALPVERRSDDAEPAPADAPGAALTMPRAGLPGWLVALTFVCIALFVAGLVVYLRRGPAGATGATAAPASDTVLVHKSDGTPWFIVDARPVSDAAFRQVFAAHTQPAAPGGAVVMVSYNDARAYASTRGGKLLTADEWDAALSTPGVQPAGDLLEWIESPESGDRTKLVRQKRQSLPRPDQGQPDVTFRMAKPPPGN